MSAADKQMLQLSLKKLSANQFSNMLQEVPSLKPGTDDSKEGRTFIRSLDKLAQTYGWPASFLSKDRRVDVDLSSLEEEELLHYNNLYRIIDVKTKDHPVYSYVNRVKVGDGRSAYKRILEYFFRNSAAAVSAAYRKFQTETMSSTNTNVMQFSALVDDNAQRLTDLGETVGDGQLAHVFLDGLLKEFSPIKLIIQQSDKTFTFQELETKILDYAISENIQFLTHSSKKSLRMNTFTADVKPCFNYKRTGECRFGDRCKYSHDGRPKAKKPRSDANTTMMAQTNTDSTVPSAPKMKSSTMYVAPNESSEVTCHLCTGKGHSVHNCPLAEQYGFYSEDEIPEVFACDHRATDPTSPGETKYSSAGPMFMICTLLVSLFTTISRGANQAFNYILNSEVKLVVVTLIVGVGTYHLAMSSAEPCTKIDAHLYFNHDDSCMKANVPLSDHHNKICCDSGTNRFVTYELEDLVPNSIQWVKTRVGVGSGFTESPCYGSMVLKTPRRKRPMICQKTLFLPKCGKKLVPTFPFVTRGLSVSFENLNQVNIRDKCGEIIIDGKERDGLYYLNCKIVRAQSPHPIPTSFFGLPTKGHEPKCSQTDLTKRLLETHYALGHLSMRTVRKMFNLKPKGPDPPCHVCAVGKSKLKQLSSNYVPSTRPCHRYHLDLGFVDGSSIIFQLAVDDYLRKSYIDFLDSKADTLQKFKDLKQDMETKHFPHKVAIIKSDSERVYDNKHWEEFCKHHGIQHEFSSPYEKRQNGVVERKMQTIGTLFRCMMIQGSAPIHHAKDALRHATLISNLAPTKPNQGMSPNEKEAGVRLPINPRLINGPLFCLVYAHLFPEESARRRGDKKSAERAVASVYIGYDFTNDAYKVMEWTTGDIFYTAHVTFHPNTFPFRADPARSKPWVYDHMAPPRSIPVQETADLRPRSLRVRNYKESGGIRIEEIPDVDSPPELPCSSLIVHNFGPDPKTWKEAMESKYADEWMKARLVEMEAFRSHDVYELVPRSRAEGHRVFRCREVFKIKLNPPDKANPGGSIEKFKYRLTIAAITRLLKEGIDYAEKFASTVRWNSIRMLLALAVTHDLDIVLFDIVEFFLYGELDDEVYMEQPPGWKVPGKPRKDYVWKLKKSLYGLPQAPRCAQKKLKECLCNKGLFKSSSADDCVYVSRDRDNYAALGAHVDDIVTIGSLHKGIASVQATLESNFEITKRVNPKLILGVQIERNRAKKWLKIHQHDYVKELLASYNMLDCKAAPTPMDPGTARSLMLLPTDNPVDTNVVHEYQVLMGKLLWIMKTRAVDMGFTVNLLSRFVRCATKAHLNIAKGRPLRYLKGTMDYGLVYCPGQENQWNLSGAADADFAGDVASSRSTSGYFTKFGQYGVTVCSSKLERKISTSTGQAETYALCSLAKEVVWQRHFLDEIGFPQKQPTPVYSDNNGVVKQASNQINHTAAKHYRVSQAFIRNLMDDTLVVHKVHTDDNAADILTKPLGTMKFLKFRSLLMGPQRADDDDADAGSRSDTCQ